MVSSLRDYKRLYMLKQTRRAMLVRLNGRFLGQLIGCLGSLAILPSMAQAADVYMSRGNDGSVIYTTQPLDSSYTLLSKGASSSLEVGLPKISARESLNIGARSEAYESLIRQVAMRYGIEPALVRAIIHVESNFNAKAISPKGATGLMQLMPDTAKRYGASNRIDPAQNLDAGARYFKALLSRYDGNVTLALSAYNAGEGSVDRHAKKVPPYRETMLYVPEVLTRYQAYKQAEQSASQE